MKKVLLYSALSVAGMQPMLAEKMESDSIRNYDLNEVVVKATKAVSSTPMAYSNLTKKELEKGNYGQDIPYLISRTPSVVVSSDAGIGIGNTSFRVRGTDATRINITVDGVPMNDSESQTVFWVNMSDFSSSVENVQIQRGVGTSTNGAAAFGASIGMQTQRPNSQPYAEVHSAAGSFGTVKNTFKGGTGLLYNHFVFDARYSKVNSDGYIDHSKADMSSYFASAAYYGQNTLIRYQILGSSERTNQAWDYVPTDSIAVGKRTFNGCGLYTETDAQGNQVQKYYDQTDNYWQQHHHLSWVQHLNEYWDFNATLHYTNGKGYYEDYKANSKLYKFGLENFKDANGSVVKKTDLVRRKWLRNDFYGIIANTSYTRENLKLNIGVSANQYDGNHTGNVIWARNYPNLHPDHTYYDSDASKLDYSAFVKANYHFECGLNAFADLQYRGIEYKMDGTTDLNYDNSDQVTLHIKDKFQFLNPKVGLSYQSNGHNTYASFAVANKEPVRNNYIYSPNNYPTHETLYDYELGYHFTNSIWNMGVNFYYMDYYNQLIATGELSDTGKALTTNIKDSYRAGIEVMAGVKICKWLEWNGNVAFSRNKIKNFVETVDYVDMDGNYTTKTFEYKTTTIALSPNVVANSIFDFHVKGFDASFSSAVVGRQYLDNTQCKDRSLDSYFVNNLMLGYTFKPSFMKEIALGVHINNIFNEQYETTGWVYSCINEQLNKPNENRYKEDGVAVQAGTNVMASLTLKF